MGMYERQLLGYNNKLLTIGGKLLRLFATGLYTFDEVNTLIYTDGYVPVATAAELDGLRTVTNQTMGVGTVWEGSYTTGLDKKYIQVRKINLSGISPWPSFSGALNFHGIYDGNELPIINYYSTTGLGLFGSVISDNARIKNVFLSGQVSVTTINNSMALISGQVTSSLAEIENCHVSGTVSASGSFTDLKRTGLLVGGNSGKIINCSATGEITTVTNAGGLVGASNGPISGSFVLNSIITSTNNRVGGFVGHGVGSTVEGCYVINTQISGVEQAGGFVGYNEASISNCYVDNITLTGGIFIGGFVGETIANITKCWAGGSVSNNATGTSPRGTGGFIGLLRTGVVSNCYSNTSVNGATADRTGSFAGQVLTGQTISNCYAIGSVSGTGTNKNSFIGLAQGNTTNCYYDSNTVGFSSGAGNARTTTQMKEGTASSFILPAGGTDPDSLAANAMYTSWDDVNTWEFGTTSEYPTLK